MPVPIRTAHMQRVEARLGRPIEEILRELYVEQGLTYDQVGERLGITKGAVSHWIERWGIEPRKPGTRQTELA